MPKEREKPEERERAEEALRDSEERYRAIFEQAADSIVLIDAETGALVQFNERAHENLGYSREEFAKLKIPDFEVIESPQEVAKHIEKIIKEGADTFETKHRTKSGEIRDIQVSSRAISIGRRDFVQSIWRDITERKRAEEGLRTSAQQWQTTFNAISDGVALLDLEHKIVRCNSAMINLIGKPFSEIIGGTCWELMHGTSEPIEGCPIVRMRETGRTETMALPMADRWLNVVADPVLDEGGNLLGAVHIISEITERKRAEEALRESEEKYRNMVEMAPDGMATVNLKGIVTSCNSAFINITGFSKSEIVGKHFSKLPTLRARDIPKYMQLFNSLIRGKVPRPFEVRWLHKDGTVHWAEIRVSLMKKGRKIIGLQAIERDITERKRAEEALRDSEERYRAIFEQAADSIVLIDAETGALVQFNERAHENLGYTCEEFQNLKIPDFEVIESPQEVAKHIEKIIKEGADTFETKHRTKSGEIRDIQVSSRAISIGRRDFVQSIWRDITECKRAEEELRESTQLLERTLYSLRDAVFIIDADMVEIMDCNPTASEIFGYSRDEMLGQTTTFLHVDEAALEGFRKHLYPAIEERGFMHLLEFKMKRKDGTVFPTEHSVMPLEDEQGKRIGWVSVVRDITERKQAEEEIRRRSEELATLNAVAMTVSSTLDLQEVLHAIQERVMESLAEVYPPLFLLFNEEDQTFKVAATRMQEQGLRRVEKLMGVNFEEVSLPLPALKPALREALLAGKPYLTDDLSDLSELGIGTRLIKDAQRALEIKSLVGLPLWVKGKFVGTVLLVSPKERMPDEEIELLAAIASQAAIAIENARLYEQTDEKLGRRVAELTALNVIAQSLTRSLELDEMLESIVTHVAQVMQARICTIRLVEGNELTIGAAVGYRDKSARQHRIGIDKRLARIVRDQQPLMVEDLWESGNVPPGRRMRAWREEVHSFLGVPMISKGETIGVLSIYGEEPHHFAQEEVRLLCTIAKQAGIAIESARPYERVREHAEELEQLVQERTKELQAIHAELLQSTKLAALGQLAAGVAHELNNPLGAISGYLELLQEEMELAPREMEYMERIEKRIQQSTKIVRELKSLGMPSEPVWQIVDVNDILEETLTLVERRFSLHQIKVQKDITPDLPLMHADPDRLEQVFINLITNARQAMAEGGTLRVTSRESRNGEWVEIIFADTGEGIAKEHLNKIFDPFFTTRGPGEGMGLGLSVSHRHIRDHGGVIDVWSEKGRGTVFRVALPPSGAKRCWEILDCDEKERCRAVRENADYRCWSVMEDVSRCERCEVYRRKALPPLDGSLLPE